MKFVCASCGREDTVHPPPWRIVIIICTQCGAIATEEHGIRRETTEADLALLPLSDLARIADAIRETRAAVH